MKTFPWRFAFSVLALTFAPCLPAVAAEKQTTSTNRATLLQWHRECIVGGYNKVGSRSEKWDAPARGGLDQWARNRAGELKSSAQTSGMIRESLQKAKDAGCNDPLVAYVLHKYTPVVWPLAVPETWQDSRALAERLEASRYHPLLKFYGHLRAAQAVSNEMHLKRDLWMQFAGSCLLARTNLGLVMREGKAPVETVEQAYRQLLETISFHPPSVETFWTQLEPTFFRSYTNEYLPWLLKAEHHITMAWKIRGNQLADKVKESAWEPFHERLETGKHAIEQAWKLNPTNYHIPNTALRLELALGDNDEMEKWFTRAMSLNPSNLTACSHKMYYLEPKWNGSPEEMIEFGRECLQSRVWTGRVPLMLAEAHDRLSFYAPEEERTNYWKLPMVWRDIRDTYESFLEKHPGDVSAHAEYANYAWMADKPDVVVKHAEKLIELKAPIRGKEAFDEMLRQAREKMGRK